MRTTVTLLATVVSSSRTLSISISLHSQVCEPNVALYSEVSNIYRFVGLVVKVPASRAEDLGCESRLRRDFSGSRYTSDFKIGTPVATLSGARSAWDWSARCQYTVTG